ncbi:MAG: ATP-binding protein [Ignavibacteria bacterium]|nr:ATP-binding protein [Ignavibacteria bacterium]
MIPKLRLRTVLILVACLFVGGALSIVAKKAIDNWTAEVIEANKNLSAQAASILLASSEYYIDSLSKAGVLNPRILTELTADMVDSTLHWTTQSVLSRFDRVEGGFYLPQINKFVGYAFPTSPPPIPRFGPPPRSYDIILHQVEQSVEKGRAFTGMHQFDPAVFPLVTIPIIQSNRIIGVAWTRIHIERELPSERIKKTFNLTAISAIAGFILVLFVSIRFYRRVREIQTGIERIEYEPTYKIRLMPGVIGSIGQYVNRMVDALSAEHQRSRELELELHQKEKMATLGRLIAGVAHEVKTPLAIIKTRTQMWQQEIKQLDKESPIHSIMTTDSLQMVVDEIDRLSKLVRRLLYFSKPVSSKLYPADVNHIIQHAIAMIQFTNGHNLESHFGENLPAVYCDTASLEQVFINLLNNAVEAMPLGGKVEISTLRNDAENAVEIRIADHGIGIAEEIRGKIFDPFFTTKNSGVGLGLSICYEIIGAHNGKLEFLPNTPNGTIFKILLPVEQKEKYS